MSGIMPASKMGFGCMRLPLLDPNDQTSIDLPQFKQMVDGSIKAGNNQERTNTLTEQVAILEGYLPEQVEGEALMALIDEVVAETGATTKKDMGRVMGTLTQRTGGNFDKAAAAATLNQRLS